jgi:excisionase family DNA binding protein
MTAQNKAVRLLRVDEFASELNITVAAVRRWLLFRKISAVKVGRLIRIPETEIARLISEGLRPAVVRREGGRNAK